MIREPNDAQPWAMNVDHKHHPAPKQELWMRAYCAAMQANPIPKCDGEGEPDVERWWDYIDRLCMLADRAVQVCGEFEEE